MKLSLNEITGWRAFEDLVADYFSHIRKNKTNNVTEVRIEKSGEGSDGGRDILLSFRVDDSVTIYERKWIVQCKFHSKALSKSHLSSENIPSLVHEYKADGYLLICSSGFSSKVTEMFENLRRNCRFSYCYECWDGNELINKLQLVPELYQKHFPEYDRYYRELIRFSSDYANDPTPPPGGTPPEKFTR